MKTTLVLVMLSLISQSVSAAEVLCSLNQGDTRFKLALEISPDLEKDIIDVIMTASSISATRNGQQSQYLVGRQSFGLDEESELFIMDRPILEGNSFDFTKVVFADGGPEDVILTISGPALENDLTFTNCLTAE